MPLVITFRHTCLSIGTPTCPELPDIAVLTGRNGAGKRGCLQAPKNGNAMVSSIRENEMALDDIGSFHVTIPHRSLSRK